MRLAHEGDNRMFQNHFATDTDNIPVQNAIRR